MSTTDREDEGLLEELARRCLERMETEGPAALDAVCNAHPGIADRLREIVDALAGVGLISATESTLESSLFAAEGAPERIGPYRILSVLGEGGMGTVYIAEQKEPVRRRVALKVIKPGMDSKEVLHRFEAERQALAMMEHGNIAKVFDAGTSERGQPYFVMEYVRGTPITAHCDQHNLSIEERIGLFRQVCFGVQHAHQKGVMHRDLKPSNVLVTVQEGRAIPKIIDFGLARATDHRLVEATIFTEQGVILGTPEYMSPEQTGLSGQDVDTRTDVYSLGVLLYELLVGELPFSPAELRQAGHAEMERKIKEDDPPKPSTKLSSTGDASEHVALRRRTDTRSLLRRLRTDLDWVVMKAIEKDRTRRYETPAALAEDLSRFLEHEPVLAGPPSAGYRVKKFLRRYRGQVVAAAAVFAVLLAGIAGTTYFMLEARSQAERADERAELEAEAREDAETNLTNFNRVASVVRLREAKAAERLLFPAWPEKIEAMRAWLDEAELLARELPLLREVLDQIRARALPPEGEEWESWVQGHPRFPQLEALRTKRDVIERAMAVRQGRASPMEAELNLELPTDIRVRNDLAWSFVDPDRTEFGREAEGLALARLVWEQVQVGSENDAYARPRTADTLAWALYAAGLDEEAIAMSEIALAAAPPQAKEQYHGLFDRLSRSVEVARSEGDANPLNAVEAEIRGLRTELSRFADQGDQFMHDTLALYVSDLEGFIEPEVGEASRVRKRLAWAERVTEISIANHETRWAEARVFIRNADGTTASELYASDPPIDLRPQVGLVPIGMNPKTRLWEFYHLRSATDPSKIPEHDEDGRIPVTPDTGIIFVLVPKGTFMMGAQTEDSRAPNYDPQAYDNERLLEVTLEPYFIAKHELTQAQWFRLSGGERPSLLNGPLLPVERVSWDMSHDLLQRHGLQLPSESEWEFACRAGTSTPWFTGTTPESLAGHANFNDELFEDGFFGTSPVGSFLPNDFGLFDMHGNVYESCQGPNRFSRVVLRGGSYAGVPFNGRASYRNTYTESAFRDFYVGVRAARAVREE